MSERHVDRSDPQERVAPVIPLFGAGAHFVASHDADGRRDGGRPHKGGSHGGSGHDGRTDNGDGVSEEDASDVDARRGNAEQVLLRKLRTRQLSVAEARTVVAGHSIADEDVETVLDDFLRRGYLDDRAFARQLAQSAAERKGQGRQVIAQTLAKRGLPREAIDEALAELPDDDAERALEFARHKARTMTRLDPEVALRRLAGQLARRGYGHEALDAARQALAEATGGTP